MSGSESAGRRSSDMDSISTGPQGSVGGLDRQWFQRQDDGRLRRGSNLSEEVAHRMLEGNSRRGSNLSEVFQRGVGVQEEEEEVDWIGSTSSGDDVSDGGEDGDAYDAETPNIHMFSSHAPVVSATPTLASIPDRSPADNSLSAPVQSGTPPLPLHSLALDRHASATSSHDTGNGIVHRGDDADDTNSVEDEGLAINLSKRGRKGSLMGHRKP